MLDIKYVPYTQQGYNGHIGQVAYIVLGDMCVFTEATLPSFSTINFAEAIAAQIARNEGRPASSLRFFDLQTRKGYSCNYPRKKPGDFVFDEVVFEGSTWWRPTICPDHVSDMFTQFIDGPPNQVFSCKPEDVQRVHFHNPADDPMPPIDEYREPPAGVAVLAEAALKMGAKCWQCDGELSMTNIRFDNHEGGWEVEGMDERQWLWFECSNGRCRYQTSFAKLHFPGNAGDTVQPQDGEQMH